MYSKNMFIKRREIVYINILDLLISTAVYSYWLAPAT